MQGIIILLRTDLFDVRRLFGWECRWDRADVIKAY